MWKMLLWPGESTALGRIGNGRMGALQSMGCCLDPSRRGWNDVLTARQPDWAMAAAQPAISSIRINRLTRCHVALSVQIEHCMGCDLWLQEER